MISIKKKLAGAVFHFAKPLIKYRADLIEQGIPKYQLEKKHVQNCRMLPTRKELIKIISSDGIGSELGVDNGNFTEIILNENNPKKLHLVDNWGSKRYNTDLKKSVEAKFANEISNGTVVLNWGLSTDVVNNFPNEYFDWIYIDTDHTYEVTYQELLMYESKMKPDGIIAGHDYVRRNLAGTMRNGVIEAVAQFCVERNWELIYITSDSVGCPSFAIKKIIK